MLDRPGHSQKNKEAYYERRGLVSYGLYLTHAHCHVTWAVADMDNCFGLNDITDINCT